MASEYERLVSEVHKLGLPISTMWRGTILVNAFSHEDVAKLEALGFESRWIRDPAGRFEQIRSYAECVWYEPGAAPAPVTVSLASDEAGQA